MVGDLPGEAHLVGDDDHRHARRCKLAHDGEDLADQLWVERRGRLVEEHELGLHRQGPRDGHALLLLATGELRRVCRRLVGQADPPSRAIARSSTTLRSLALTLIRASADVLGTVLCGKRLNRWKTMPMSRRWAAISLSEAVGPRPCRHTHELAVDEDPAPSIVSRLVDAADEGRLARAGRPEEDDDLAG